MSAAWLLLFLGGHVHLLTLNGISHPMGAAPLIFLPVLACALLPGLRRHGWFLFKPAPAAVIALLGLGASLLLGRWLLLDAWETSALLPDVLLALTGLGLLWTAAREERPSGPGAWAWVGLWMLAGFLDPVLPLVGAGLAGALPVLGLWPERAAFEAPPLRSPLLAFFLLGLAVPKVWWDFGLQPDWAFASAALGLGAALAGLRPFRQRLANLPEGILLWSTGLLSVLYHPTVSLAWGLVLGLAAGSLEARRRQGLTPVSMTFLLGLSLSFALHANAWIPGLRHLIWLGN